MCWPIRWSAWFLGSVQAVTVPHSLSLSYLLSPIVSDFSNLILGASLRIVKPFIRIAIACISSPFWECAMTVRSRLGFALLTIWGEELALPSCTALRRGRWIDALPGWLVCFQSPELFRCVYFASENNSV